MTMTCEPDYAKAQFFAYKTLQKSKQDNLPISVKKIIKKIPNLHIQSYTSFANKRGITIKQTCEFLDSEEGCLWMRSDKTYVIFYNDTIQNNGRIRFTLAHELGHYILKHNELGSKTKLMRYSLSDTEYDIFEKEANYFAKRLLAPIPLIDAIVLRKNKISIHQLEEIFNISFSVAGFLVNELNKRKRLTNISREIHELVLNFKHELSILNFKKCSFCDSEIDSKHENCPICGKNNFIDVMDYGFKKYKKARSAIMIYSKIDTNENGTPNECPKCHAENLDDKFMFCPWCSTILHNYCLGTKENRYIQTSSNGDFEEKSIHEQIHEGCGKIIDGSFRYCPQCGGETSYYREKLLKSWEEELPQAAPFSSDIFNNLPF
ncbi:ImmA/IrrE family metallo-endopeptidase [Enterococcus faecalis]|nr:ImmA/IrrE family metallo-endopeptidase [Enterococcus faecalis]NRE03388.1 ImmA/IrrE family metallo-endopeptidase [Enterococcus faecalis]NRE07493.1 ImmA/IrrE family metallo-endopeptidase [Enterococcus faecalis]NRE10105.1 ImmA/IrrE family metallo-endopeptidase [Enterococcus faecalis]NRE16235.1 ImmA/IrrE family metallo-endopeptidase [Enterococcus faecalis]